MPEYKFTIGSYPSHKNPKLINLTGQHLGRFWVIGFAGIINKAASWHCICDCGNGRTVIGANLTSGKHLSCGCLRNERLRQAVVTHGESMFNVRSPEWRIYKGAKSRCNNVRHKQYADYGGRGIEFRLANVTEMLDAIGRRPTPKHSLDRIDNNGHYEIGNIRWATPTEQSHNKRNNKLLTAFGQTKCISAWAKEIHLCVGSLYDRLKCRWCNECAVSIPARQGKCLHR